MHRLRTLSSSKGRDKASSLLLEGTHLLSEALKTGFMPSEIVLTSKWLEEHSSLLVECSSDVEVHIVTEDVLKASLTTFTPDGVASLFPIKGLPTITKQSNFILALDRVQDPGNMGTLFRTALAAEVEEIWLALGADPFSQKVLRSSAGAVLHLPFKRLVDMEENVINELLRMLKKAQIRGLQVVGTFKSDFSKEKDVIPYWEIDWQKPTVLVLGNEGSGIHPKVQAFCTHKVTLPHNENVESLNVASAAVPLLLERLRAKMTS